MLAYCSVCGASWRGKHLYLSGEGLGSFPPGSERDSELALLRHKRRGAGSPGQLRALGLTGGKRSGAREGSGRRDGHSRALGSPPRR